MSNSTIYRIVKDNSHPYVLLNKGFLENKNLSVEAKGFLAYCMTRPNDWHFNKTHLCDVLGFGETRFYSIVKDLTKNNYCYHYRKRDEMGRTSTYQYCFFESQEECQNFKLKVPHRDFRSEENPSQENPSLTNNESSLQEDIVYIDNNTYIPPSGGSSDPIGSDVFVKKKNMLIYGKYVKIQVVEYEKLKFEIGESKVIKIIKDIENFLLSTGNKPYKDYAATIRIWHKRQQEKEMTNAGNKGDSIPRKIPQSGYTLDGVFHPM